MFSAICFKGKKENLARILEGPVQPWKIFGSPKSGNGFSASATAGYPRFSQAAFTARFPFGTVALRDPKLPVEVEITGWSPFLPGDADNSSLPCAALEYRVRNRSRQTFKAVYSFHAQNFLPPKPEEGEIRSLPSGFILSQPGAGECSPTEASVSAAVLDGPVKVNCRWFRGGWFDPATLVWNQIVNGEAVSHPPYTSGKPSSGASLFVPMTLAPGREKIVRLLLTWYVPNSDVRARYEEQDKNCCSPETSGYRPWYAGRFKDIRSAAAYWRSRYNDLRQGSKTFSDCFYDSTLPPEVTEAVAANLAILKSPTVLRQTDGRLWAWEGCNDDKGCCDGSCTHVWNYAQALPHLFPALERTLRQTEFFDNQNAQGHQGFRAALPIRPLNWKKDHDFHAAADGQLGGIMKVYREWRISGDTAWMGRFWPAVKASLGFCIKTWDPKHKGIIEEPHHNTYDIEFWGPDGMHGTFYLGALQAAIRMGRALGMNSNIYEQLFERGREFLEKKLYNGEYFFQKIQWKGLQAPDPIPASARSLDL
jgi:uncharacterized protein (DUF608 family)